MKHISIIAVAVVSLVVLSPALTHAESTAWYSPVLPDLYGDLGTVSTVDTYPALNFPGYYYSLMLGTQARVSYGVRAIDMTTGTVIACDPANPSHVPAGTEVRFEYLPHENTDISWNATGAYWDTPYGSWSAAGERTGDALCTPDRLYFTETAYACSGACQNHNRSYGELSVARPEKEIAVSGASCSQAVQRNRVSWIRRGLLRLHSTSPRRLASSITGSRGCSRLEAMGPATS